MSRNSEMAAKVRSEMAGILKSEIPVQATPENLQKIAHRFKDRKNFPESFLFYKFVLFKLPTNKRKIKKHLQKTVLIHLF